MFYEKRNYKIKIYNYKIKNYNYNFADCKIESIISLTSRNNNIILSAQKLHQKYEALRLFFAKKKYIRLFKYMENNPFTKNKIK